MLERDVEAYLKKRVAEHDGEVRKVQWLGRHGAPDRLVLLSGDGFFAELKRPKKNATKAQNREHDRLRNAGFKVFLINTTEAVDLLFEKLETTREL